MAKRTLHWEVVKGLVEDWPTHKVAELIEALSRFLKQRELENAKKQQ